MGRGNIKLWAAEVRADLAGGTGEGAHLSEPSQLGGGDPSSWGWL